MTSKILLEHHGETVMVVLLIESPSQPLRPYVVRTYRRKDNAVIHTTYHKTARDAASEWLYAITDEEPLP
ncbi:hypothetical protein LCGC14_1396660 [marine sediment metagenome]|uniref:Uncharacterized protein n=1 Tax=marine sediment metagenome TaxID=412755 RepID=A0A0F9JYK7_9ZZZZ